MRILLDPIFKSKDRVYHYKYVWGTIMEIHNGVNQRILIEFDEVKNLIREMKAEENLLSFTEYTLEGFTQERPEPLPNKGDIVWVRDSYSEAWRVVHFCGMHNKYFKASNIYNDPTSPCWNFMTTENPYKYEHTTNNTK